MALFLYMFTTRKEGVQTITQLGCCSDVGRRLDMYNSTDPLPGMDRRARSAAGTWRMLLIITVPTTSGISARSLVNHWKTKSRKIHCRFAYGVYLARTLGLPFMVDAAELRADQRICIKEKRLVHDVLSAMAEEPTDVAKTVFGVRPLRTILDGIDFAKSARPRRQPLAPAQKKMEEKPLEPVLAQQQPPQPPPPLVMKTLVSEALRM